MDVRDAIRMRRSIRKYKDKEIEEEKLKLLLEAARLAPSAKNRQNWIFVVVRDKEIKKQLIPACKNQEFVGEASVVIAGVSDPNVSRWYKIDMGIAFEHIALEAVELGLGTCWIGAFYEEQVKKVLNIPEDLEVVVLITIGYPAEEPMERPRKRLDEIIRYERFT
ncbi:MAG: nitroreductase [Thermoplasmata archaeon]|nr:nitroreductase family protein [Thermoplasmata archaeon]RLF30668.1 MAG: nitroreductase [Thermoplasmata archaeon]